MQIRDNRDFLPSCNPYGIYVVLLCSSCLMNKYAYAIFERDFFIITPFFYTPLDWVSKGNIGDYMSRHRYDDNISELKNDNFRTPDLAQMSMSRFQTSSLNWMPGKSYGKHSLHQ